MTMSNEEEMICVSDLLNDLIWHEHKILNSMQENINVKYIV